MGFFSFLFSKNHDPVGECFPAEWVIKEAFDKVVAGVILPARVKNDFYKAFLVAHQSGNPRNEHQAAIIHLYKSGWVWTDFDKWHEIFSIKKKWPYMWEDNIGLYDEPLKQPKTMKTALKFLTVTDMKNLLKDNRIKPKPAPKKRADFEEAMKAYLLFKKIEPYVSKIIESKRLQKQEAREKSKCKLLVHTLIMTAYELGHDYQRRDLNGSPQYRRQKAETCDGICPIEREYARKFNRGELQGLPPFFPGDRTYLM